VAFSNEKELKNEIVFGIFYCKYKNFPVLKKVLEEKFKAISSSDFFEDFYKKNFSD
jgi:hypothetical protein